MIEKISLRMPPNSMFQPVTSEFRNNITFTEFLLGVLKKLNETITEVNSVSEYIKDFDTKYQELLTEFNELKAEFNSMKEDIVNEVSNKLTEFYAKVENEIVIAVNYLKAYSDNGDRVLNDKIDQIILGDIQVIDPTTGVLAPLQEVINNIATTGRDALTATEYDALELTASAYDGYTIDAYDYDYHGKAILMA